METVTWLELLKPSLWGNIEFKYIYFNCTNSWKYYCPTKFYISFITFFFLPSVSVDQLLNFRSLNLRTCRIIITCTYFTYNALLEWMFK